MPIAENEALASLRILVAVARADGTVHEDERKSLAAALESLRDLRERVPDGSPPSGLELPGGTTVEKLLAEEVDVDAALRELTSEEAREQIYRSAYFMAHADGECSKDEQDLLDLIATATDPTAETRASLDRMFVGRAKGGSGSSALTVVAIADPAARAEEIGKRVLRYSVLSAALGAFPIPGLAIATDLAVIALQLKMIRDVGGLYGHSVDTPAAKSMLYGLGLGTGARLAVNNLAKLLPGWGSVIGATTSFGSTYALGKVIEKFFGTGHTGQADAAAVAEMRSEFKAAEQAAREVYANKQDVIIQSQRDNKLALDRLTAALKNGDISQDEFDEQVAGLA